MLVLTTRCVLKAGGPSKGVCQAVRTCLIELLSGSRRPAPSGCSFWRARCIVATDVAVTRASLCRSIATGERSSGAPLGYRSVSRGRRRFLVDITLVYLSSAALKKKKKKKISRLR